MSRTYTHGLKARQRYFGGRWDYPRNEWRQPLRGSRPKRKRGKHECEWMTTPSWWIREFMNRPLRRSIDAAIRRQLDRSWEDVVMPHMKRPHIYYW